MGVRAAHGMCPELMEREISSDPFPGGYGQVSGFKCCSSGISGEDFRKHLFSTDWGVQISLE